MKKKSIKFLDTIHEEFSSKPCAYFQKGSNVPEYTEYKNGGKYLKEITFLGKKTIAQFDQGAECTLVSTDFYKSLLVKPECRAQVKLSGYKKDSAYDTGKILENVEIGIDGHVFHFPPVVGPSAVPVLIGADFMRSFKMDISTNDCCIYMGKQNESRRAVKIPLEFTGDYSDTDDLKIKRICVTLDHKITVGPHEGKTIYIPPKSKDHGLMIFESFQFKDLLIANSLVQPKQGVEISIMNFSDEKKKLPQGLRLGEVSDCNRITVETIEKTERSDLNASEGSDSKENSSENSSFTISVKSCNIDNCQICTCELKKEKRGNDPKHSSVFVSTDKTSEIPEKEKVTLKHSIKFKKYENVFPATSSKFFEELVNSIPEHIREMFRKSCNCIDLWQAARFADTCTHFSNSFSKSQWDLGCCTVIEHVCDTGDALPVTSQLRRTPMHFAEQERETLLEMLKAGVIAPSTSPWCSPVMLVRKKDKGLRWTVDLRQLNDVTKKCKFPLPRVDECIASLQGKTYYSVIDASSGFFQIPVHKDSVEKFAFICKYGLFHHLRMPQGASNSPATYQRVMTYIMRNLQWIKMVSFLDDCVVFGSNFDEALDNLEEVLTRFSFYNLKLKPKKSSFFQESIVFLGRKIDKNGISVTEDHIEQIRKWQPPTDVMQLESFLGYANYQRAHLKRISEHTESLYKIISEAKQLTKNAKSKKAYQRVKVSLNNEQMKDFENLKQDIIDAPVLPMADPDKYFLVDVDASGKYIGAELQQLVDGEVKVIEYGSRLLKPAQRNYCASKREMLAAIAFCRQWRHYLIGRPFLLRTDSAALTFLLSMKHTDGQMNRWIMEFSQYCMTLIHRKGSEHINADYQSRPPIVDEECNFFESEVPLTALPCCKFEADGTPIICKSCEKLKNNWKDFDEKVDDTLPYVGQATINGVQSQLKNESLAHKNLEKTLPFLGVISQIDLDFSHLDPKDVDVSIALPGKTPEELQILQENDYEFGKFIKWLKGPGPTKLELTLTSPALRHYWICRKQFVFISGVLYYRWEDLLDSRFLLCVPSSMKDDVFFYCHDHVWKGHPGIHLTNDEIRRRFYWWGRSTDTELYVKTCLECQTCKFQKRKPKSKMLMHHSGFPGQKLHCDIVGPLTKSRSGNTVLFTIIDQFTKFFMAYPLPDQKGETIAEVFVRDYCPLFGTPNTLVSDNGKNFILGVFSEVVKRLQIHKNNICAYKPSSNGAVERAHLSLFNKLRCHLMRTRDFKNWDKYVNFCTGAMRSTVNRTTGFTPNFLTFGRELNQPADIAYGSPVMKNDPTLSDYVKNLVETMTESYKMVRENVEGSLEIAKSVADRKSFEEKYNIGDVVYVRDTKIKKHKLSAKLLPLFKGPMLIVKKLNAAVYYVHDGKEIFSVHHDRILQPNTEVFPIWLLKLRAELFKHPEKFVDANMNRIGDPIGQVRNLYGDYDRNRDKSLLHDITKKSKKKFNKKSQKNSQGEQPVETLDEFLDSEPLVEKVSIKGNLISDLPETSNFDLLNNEITSTPIAGQHLPNGIKNDQTFSSESDLELSDIINKELENKSTDFNETMPYGKSTDFSETLPYSKSTDFDKTIPYGLPNVQENPILENSEKINNPETKISIPTAVKLPVPERRSARGRVANTKYQNDYV